jgi:hypothetical protein
MKPEGGETARDGYIGGDRPQARLVARWRSGNGLLEPLLAPARQHDARPFGRQRQRGCAADAGSGSNHDGHLVLEPHWRPTTSSASIELGKRD